MLLKNTELNTLLGKVNGGSTFADTYYWSSSEYGSSGAWDVKFSSGRVGDYAKYSGYQLRLVRAI